PAQRIGHGQRQGHGALTPALLSAPAAFSSPQNPPRSLPYPPRAGAPRAGPAFAGRSAMPPDKEGPERLPPQSREAECSVLGSMLRDNAVIGDVVQVIRTEDFYADAHQKVFQAIIDLHDKGGQPVDVVILAEELKQRNQIADVG